MRWLLVSGLIGLAWWWGSHQSTKKIGWELVCQRAPYRQQLPKHVYQGLVEAKVMVGLRGWQPTVQWINEQCEVLFPKR